MPVRYSFETDDGSRSEVFITSPPIPHSPFLIPNSASPIIPKLRTQNSELLCLPPCPLYPLTPCPRVSRLTPCPSRVPLRPCPPLTQNPELKTQNFPARPPNPSRLTRSASPLTSPAALACLGFLISLKLRTQNSDLPVPLTLLPLPTPTSPHSSFLIPPTPLPLPRYPRSPRPRPRPFRASTPLLGTCDA